MRSRVAAVGLFVVLALTVIFASGSPVLSGGGSVTVSVTSTSDASRPPSTTRPRPSGGQPSRPPTQEEIWAAQGACAGLVVGAIPAGGGGEICQGGTDGAAPPSAAAVAAIAYDEVPVVIPAPHTSPPEGGAQLVGLRTWFWLDADAWRPVMARAELGGVWAEVTATPVRAEWVPGDGGSTVTCDGPARPHPGTSGATTDCGHVYTVHGDYVIELRVVYEVTWSSSTGESGTQDPIVLTTDLPIHVEQRQAVIE